MWRFVIFKGYALVAACNRNVKSLTSVNVVIIILYHDKYCLITDR